jgi:hypothetical protein
MLRGFAERTGTPEPSLYVYVTDPPNLIDDKLPVVTALAEVRRAEGDSKSLPLAEPVDG